MACFPSLGGGVCEGCSCEGNGRSAPSLRGGDGDFLSLCSQASHTLLPWSCLEAGMGGDWSVWGGGGRWVGFDIFAKVCDVYQSHHL